MNPKTTLFLLLLTVMLLGGIVWLNQNQPSTRERLLANEAAVAFDEKRLDHVEMQFADGRSFALMSSAGMWRLTQPFDDMADPERVERLVKALSSMQVVERLERREFDAAGWKATGLDGPEVKVRLTAGAEILKEFWLGKATALEDTCYASLPAESGDERQLLVLKTSLLTVLKEAPTLWRDMKLLRLPAEAITRIQLASEDGLIEVTRSAGGKQPWDLVKPLQTRGSTEQINELLAVLLNLEVTNAELAVVQANPGAAAAGSAPAVDQIKIAVDAAGRTYELIIKKPAVAGSNEAEATAAHRRPQFKVRSDQLLALWCEPNELRDDHLARVDTEKIASIGIRSETFPELELKKENESWLLKRHGRWEPANGDRVARFFETLNDTRVREFTADSAAVLAPYGLDRPFMKIWWKGTKPETVGELLVGQSPGRTGFYAKHAAEPFVYRISADVLPMFPPDSLKWKGRGVVRFSQFDLKQIVLTIGVAPSVVLDYDPISAVWQGKVGDQDVTALIDRVKADRFANALGKLSAEDWASALAEGLEALKKPTIQIQVTLQQAGQVDAEMKTMQVRFAPTQPDQDTAFYYGRVDEAVDVFYLSREALRDLVKPVFRDDVQR